MQYLGKVEAYYGFIFVLTTPNTNSNGTTNETIGSSQYIIPCNHVMHQVIFLKLMARYGKCYGTDDKFYETDDKSMMR